MPGRFYTDLTVAKKMVELANRFMPLEGKHVLEPSSGDGSIAVTLKAVPGVQITCVEKSKSAFEALTKNMKSSPGVKLMGGDFMLLPTTMQFDAAVANPPYENGQDIEHTGKMLDHAPFVVGLYRGVVPHLSDFHVMLVKKNARLHHMVTIIGRPQFHGPDDKGDTPRHEYSILVIARPPFLQRELPTTHEFFSVAKRLDKRVERAQAQ